MTAAGQRRWQQHQLHPRGVTVTGVVGIVAEHAESARAGPLAPPAIGVVAVDRTCPDHREQAHLLVVAEVVGVDLVRRSGVELLTVPATAQGVTSGLAQLGGVKRRRRGSSGRKNQAGWVLDP